ncbi:hypothetical protein YTPLAS18_29980 [Nitrospira sp.]|nr:hypothetical protein YTPLAS18_29980 [Nitrospira sp.]
MARTLDTSTTRLAKLTVSAPAILLVDDSKEFLDLWWRRLSSHGFHVFTAAGSSEALQLVRSHHPVIKAMILDLVLEPPVLRLASRKQATPRVHGDRLAKVLRQRYPDLGIVLTSALSERELTRHGIRPDLGQFPFLPKPIEENRLIAELHTIVSKKRTDPAPPLEAPPRAV